MRIHSVVPIAVLALTLGSFSAEAAQQGERRSRTSETRAERGSRGNSSARARDNEARGSREQSQARRSAATPSEGRNQSANRQSDRSRERANEANARRTRPANRGGAEDRAVPRGSADRGRNPRADQRADSDRGRNPRVDNRRPNNRGVPQIRRNNSRYYAPRPLPRRLAPPRYYGRGGGLALYFGWGSGYRYGSIYTGRVYGYRGRVISGYGPYRYYGDLRLKVTPRDAAVYVDGYYAGIVDDFDGFFQRLTVEVGPHVIEIDAPGLEPQVFDVYVDGARTIDLHANLFR